MDAYLNRVTTGEVMGRDFDKAFRTMAKRWLIKRTSLSKFSLTDNGLEKLVMIHNRALEIIREMRPEANWEL